MIERAVTVGEIEVMTRRWPQLGDRSVANGPAVVLLHEGLGSSTQWRELPQRIRERTSSDVYAYDRPGYGRSSPAPSQFTPDFMHHEASVTLPAVLEALDIERPVLIGHSDGASIALLAAAHEPSAQPGSTTQHVEPTAVGVIAPHIRVEQECLDGITAIAGRRDTIVRGLARHHEHAELVFDRWRDVWLDPRFRSWDISAQLPTISCPVIAVQGDRDEYATPAMVNDLVELVPDSSGYFLTDCGHVAHRDQPDAVLELVLDTVKRGSVS